MQESDTYLAILDEGQEKARREDILVVGEERIEPARRGGANRITVEHAYRLFEQRWTIFAR